MVYLVRKRLAATALFKDAEPRVLARPTGADSDSSATPVLQTVRDPLGAFARDDVEVKGW